MMWEKELKFCRNRNNFQINGLTLGRGGGERDGEGNGNFVEWS